MKKHIYFLAYMLMMVQFGHAQLADGTTVPDFTFKDMNGVSHNLYTYLNQGKYVALDISATWCGPCWEYHSSVKAMEDLYQKHDDAGDQTMKVLFVEGDDDTNDECMKNISGCSSSTQGDWLNGTLYAMCNPPAGTELNNFLTNYKIEFFPTLYLICPNKKVYAKALNDESAPWPAAAEWENVMKECGAAGIDNPEDQTPLTIYPNPGKERVGLYFNLNNNCNIKLQVMNSIGQTVDSRDFGLLPEGNQFLYYLTDHLEKGIYFFILSVYGSRSIAKKVVIQ